MSVVQIPRRWRAARHRSSLALGNILRVKSKLIIVAVIAGALLCGFWVGSYRTRKAWEEIAERQNAVSVRNYNRGMAAKALPVLRLLTEGKHSEARELLEQQLDSGLATVAAYASYTPSDVLNEQVIRSARAYRSQHPWTNPEPRLVQGVQKAFKMAD